MRRLVTMVAATHSAIPKCGKGACVLACALALVGCESKPPSSFFVRGTIDSSGILTMEINDAYVWRQPNGDSAFVLVTEHTLPPLPVDDPYAITDLGLLLEWSHAPYASLTLDPQGSLLGFAARNGNGGGTLLECAHNGGRCYSAVGYWSARSGWGDDSMLGSYEFDREVDVALAQPIHRQTRFQTPPLSERDKGIDPQGHPWQPAASDYANMFARYVRVRAALDANTPQAFLEANGYSAALADAMLKFDNISAGVARLAAGCPHSDSYELFGNHGGFGSLLIHHRENETPIYFVRRGDDWVLKECGGN